MRRFVGLLIGLILVIIVGSIFECSDKNKTEKELVKFWGEETFEYFKNFNCKGLSYQPKEIEFNKIFLIRGRFGNCELWKEKSWEINFKDFNNSNLLSEHLVNKVQSADIIVWINVEQNGEKYGNYSNGAYAIRNNFAVNLIDKQTRTIFKKETFEGIGEPPNEILRKQSEDRPEYFGSIPSDKIIDFLMTELKK
ncbi:hypothetical protein [Gaetbulibacter aestuarii]|uniref:Lipoprotein n=1 Tax=Gaetbulibacter aestuarii TaxID=1502358 RepID=A0ABW7N135_9FLAO